MTIRPVSNQLSWLGRDDRLLLDDVSCFGLRRRVIARKGEMMDVEAHIQLAADMARGAEVYGWLVESEGINYLWIVWKERT